MTTVTSSSSLISGQPSSVIQEPLVPSINFAMVCPGVYRSGYPTRKNYCFLRALRLRTILYLCPEDYAESNVKFCEENGINILRFPTEGNKEPFMDISEQLMHRILSSLIDTQTHPVLIHCNKGKHRTGAVVACLRLLQGWSLVSIFEEYRRFAGDKARMGDQQYVELYHPIVRVRPPYVAKWLCVTPNVTFVETEEELQAAEAQQLGWSLIAPPPQQQQVQQEQQLPPKTPLVAATSIAESEPQVKLKEEVQQPMEEISMKRSNNNNNNNNVEKITSKSCAALGAAAPITTTMAARRSGGNSELSSIQGKTRENTTTIRKEIGEGKKNQK